MRFNIRLVTLVVGSMFAFSACSESDDETRFQVQCHCSIVQLIVNPNKYTGKQVRVAGVLIPVSMTDGVARLYLTNDDARYLNDSNSIFVDVRNSKNQKLVALRSVTGKYVVVEGRFLRNDNQLTIDHVFGIRPLPSLPLDNSRFEGISDEQ